MMKLTHIANIQGGQDGAIYGDYLFRFDEKGRGRVYDAAGLTADGTAVTELPLLCELTLDKAELIAPHSNAVVFGKDFYEEGDEFPLLYTNVYNNYAGKADPLIGVCCVYRVKREGARFFTTLVQLIRIGFAESRGLWRSAEGVSDIRPYGNFVIDTRAGLYYAFVMRDGEQTTRYFSFDLPSPHSGETDAALGVPQVILTERDMKDYFDVPYHHYLQGAVLYNGLIYSVEGFNRDVHPALRVIDPSQKKQLVFFDLFEAGFELEAEFMDVHRGVCLYGDAHGHLFAVDIAH